MDKIEVTVLMSMYNTPIDQLKQAIESIINQTYKNFEFLIIDDYADPICTETVEKYKDTRIRLIHNENNIGLEKSLNKGLKLAAGKYIIRMDTDDISYPDRIQKQIEFAKKHPEYSIIGGRANYFNEDGIYGTSTKKGEITKKDLLFGTPFIHPSMLIRKKDILSIGGYPLYKRCEDYAMVMEMYAKGFKGYIMDTLVIKYRMDDKAYLKKKFRYRIIETEMKIKYFRKLNVEWYKYIFAIKPIIVGLIPAKIIKKYHKYILGGATKIT